MSKGKRREREAEEMYQEAGYETFKPQESKFGETDMFGLFDILAVSQTGPNRLCQVSTNANGRLDFMNRSYWFVEAGFKVEYMQVYSREGWRVMAPHPQPGEWDTVLDERDENCKMGELVVEYLEDGLNVSQ